MHLTQRRRGGWVIGDTENRFATAISLFPSPLASPCHFQSSPLSSVTLSFPLAPFTSSSQHFPAFPLPGYLTAAAVASPDSGTKGGSLHRQSSLCHSAYLRCSRRGPSLAFVPLYKPYFALHVHTRRNVTSALRMATQAEWGKVPKLRSSGWTALANGWHCLYTGCPKTKGTVFEKATIDGAPLAFRAIDLGHAAMMIRQTCYQWLLTSYRWIISDK